MHRPQVVSYMLAASCMQVGYIASLKGVKSHKIVEQVRGQAATRGAACWLRS